MTVSVAMAFVEQVRRFQRRAATVAFVRYGVLTALVVAAAMPGMLRIDHSLLPAFVAGAIAAGALVAAGLTLRLRPDLRQTARAIDARGGFDNCVTTALQFAASDDPIAGLIVRDAQRRLESVSAAAIFPVTLDLSARAVATVGAAALLAFAMGRQLAPPVPGLIGDQGVGASDAAVPAADAARARSAPRGSTPSAGPGIARATSAARPAAPAARSPQPGVPSGAAGASPAQPSPAAEATARTLSPGSSANQPEPGADKEQRADGNSSGRAAQVKSGAQPTAAGDQAANGRGAAAGAGLSARGSGRQAGGASGGTLTAPGAPAGGAAAPAAYAARYGAAAARTEQALEREQIPAELRDSVRAYFSAIRP